VSEILCQKAVVIVVVVDNGGGGDDDDDRSGMRQSPWALWLQMGLIYQPLMMRVITDASKALLE
jgi:hypothetical protein